jgi:hypothetical protein
MTDRIKKSKNNVYLAPIYSAEVARKIYRIVKNTAFMGIGNSYRQISQYRLLKKWEQEYSIRSALEAPYDHATLGVDGLIFSFKAEKAIDLINIPSNTYDLVWNFGFIQRKPILIYEMKRVSKRYIAAFVPNIFNPGVIFHKLYHKLYKTPCYHPERGHPTLMTLKGLQELFKEAGIRIVEKGYVDIPIWPDTVVTLRELLGAKKRGIIYIKPSMKMLYTLVNLEKILYPKIIFAHHCYVLGEKI